jgi:ABC-2 type transport system ATP-binding protein
MLLEVKNLSAWYTGAVVLKSLELKVSDNQIHGLLGANGAGKTTFFKALARLHKMIDGEILLDGRPLKATEISLLETDPYFYPYMKGWEYLRLSGNATKDQQQKWADLLAIPINNYIQTYSTGMKKKLAFAAVILQNRPVVLMDEPFNGVDLEGTEIMTRVLNTSRSEGKIIVVSSHILSMLTAMSNKISYLWDKGIYHTFLPHEYDYLTTEIKKYIEQKTDKMMRS